MVPSHGIPSGVCTNQFGYFRKLLLMALLVYFYLLGLVKG